MISEVDVSKLKATEERAQFLAEHDLLTKLPNRNYVTTTSRLNSLAIETINSTIALLFSPIP